ncbi:MAG: hypothetical protein ABI222_11645 [Opitutaceae bacterium]
MIGISPQVIFLGVLVLTCISLTAQTASSPAPSSEKAAAFEETSPRLQALLTTSLPAFGPVKLGPMEKPQATDPVQAHLSGGDVVVMSRFVVRDAPPPKTEDLLTVAGQLDRYLGPKDGLDRGYFNKLVFHWGDGATGFALFDAETNETRAKDRAFDDQRLRHRAELLDLAETLKDTGDEELAKQVKFQSDDLFRREPPFNRK